MDGGDWTLSLPTTYCERRKLILAVLEIDENPELNIEQVRRMETFDRNEAGMFNEYFRTFLSNDKALEKKISEQDNNVLTNEELEEILK